MYYKVLPICFLLELSEENDPNKQLDKKKNNKRLFIKHKNSNSVLE